MPLRPGPGGGVPGAVSGGHGELPGATRASLIPVPERLPPAAVWGRARCSPAAGPARRVAALAEVPAEPAGPTGRPRSHRQPGAFRGIPDPRGVPLVPGPQRLRPAGGLRRGRPGRGAVGGRARTAASGGDLGDGANGGSGGSRGMPRGARRRRGDARESGGCGDRSGMRGRGGGRGPAVRSGRCRDCGPTYVRGSRDRGSGSRRRRRARARRGGGRSCCAPRAPSAPPLPVLQPRGGAGPAAPPTGRGGTGPGRARRRVPATPAAPPGDAPPGSSISPLLGTASGPGPHRGSVSAVPGHGAGAPRAPPVCSQAVPGPSRRSGRVGAVPAAPPQQMWRVCNQAVD